MTASCSVAGCAKKHLACKVDLAETVKARRCRVLYEVDAPQQAEWALTVLVGRPVGAPGAP